MEKEVENKIAFLNVKEIRKTMHEGEWWFVIDDVVSALTDSVQPKGYIKDMRRRDKELSKGWGQIATPLSINTIGGKQKLNCGNTESIFRLIQSIPSPKAEPFKLWLAKEVGEVAGNARMELESKTGKKISTDENYIDVPEKVKRLKGER